VRKRRSSVVLLGLERVVVAEDQGVEARRRPSAMPSARRGDVVVITGGRSFVLADGSADAAGEVAVAYYAPQKASVADLAASVGVSRSTLTRRFRDRVGEAPMRYLAAWRLALAAEQLRTSDALLEIMAHRVGYADGFALSRAFTRAYGVSPSAYRARPAEVERGREGSSLAEPPAG
jgi:AraC-like DNA-binding protein